MNIAVSPPMSPVSSEALDAIRQPINEAAGMPNEAYTSTECFQFERDHLFAPNWFALGFVARFPERMVHPVDFMGLPLLVSHDKTGELRVFHNVCSHRGIKLVDAPRKTNGLIVCPYHSWTYAMNGDLKATPHIGGVGVHTLAGFDCASRGLKHVRSHIWNGILFVNLDGSAAPFMEAMAKLISRYQTLAGASAEGTLRADTNDGFLEMSLQCNWKLAIENYLESYHLPFIHPGLNSYSPLSKHRNEIIDERAAGQITSTFDPDLGGDNPLPLFPEWDAARLQTGEYPALYPNLLLGFQANHFFAMIIHPESPDRCREELMIFYAGDAAMSNKLQTTRKMNREAWTAVFNEDIEPCERMQIGRQSPGFQGGAFSPFHDACSLHFHRWVAAHYSGTAQAS